MQKLFLDDVRVPTDCVGYMHSRIGKLNPIYLERDWKIVRNYTEFVSYIEKYNIPELISFDHDLADGHYHKNMQEGVLNYESDDFQNDDNKTGYHCLEWLIKFCKEQERELPVCIFHTMNPVGLENMRMLVE